MQKVYSTNINMILEKRPFTILLFVLKYKQQLTITLC